MKKYFVLLVMNCIAFSQLSAQFLSISGTTNQGSGLLGNGIVFAINRSKTTTKIDKIMSGSYLADSLLTGNYIVYAIPNPSTKTYLPTYFLNKQNPNQANSFDLIGLASEVDIYLIQKTFSENGNSSLNLRFYYEGPHSDANTDFSRKWFTLPTPQNTIFISGAPCQTLPVLLYNQQNQIIDWGLTDNEGYVQFKNLVGGTYYARSQRYDYITQDDGYINTNSETNRSLYLTRNLITHLENASSQNGNLSVYPNPFADQLIIKEAEKDFTISDLAGSIYYSSSSFANQTISTTDWPKGIYLLKMGDRVHKILKY